MIIRKLQINDLNKACNLIKEHLNVKRRRLLAFFIHFILDLPLKSLGLDTIIGSVAQTHEGNIVGAIITSRFPLSKTWVMGPVVVDRRHRGLGIGTSITELVLKSLRDKGAKGAMVSVGGGRRHSPARKLFEKFGFKYLKRVFVSHDQARKYVRTMTLTKFPYMAESFSKRIDLAPSSRTYCVMLKEL